MNNAQMINELEKRGYKIDRERRTIIAPAKPRRQTLALMSEASYDNYGRRSGSASSWLEPELHPRHWKALSDRRVPFPRSVDPETAVAQMSKFLAHQIATSGNPGLVDWDLDV